MQLSDHVEDERHHLLAYMGCLLFLCVQMSTLRTVQMISEQESTRDLSPIPFLSLLVNSCVGTTYAVLTWDLFLFTPNVIGMISGLYAVMIFHRNAAVPLDPKEVYALPSLYVILAVYIAFGGVPGVTSLDRVQVVGCLMVAAAVFMTGAPLATMRIVFASKSTVVMPFWTSVFGLLNATAWFLYGLLDVHDMVIWMANMVGMLLGILQMMLFAVFGVPVGTFEGISCGRSRAGTIGRLVRSRSKRDFDAAGVSTGNLLNQNVAAGVSYGALPISSDARV